MIKKINKDKNIYNKLFNCYKMMTNNFFFVAKLLKHNVDIFKSYL